MAQIQLGRVTCIRTKIYIYFFNFGCLPWADLSVLFSTVIPVDPAFTAGPLMGGPPCRMSIIRNGNVALSNLRKPHVTLSILRKSHVALSILRKCYVPCR